MASSRSASQSSGSSNDSPASSELAADAAERYCGPLPLSRLCRHFRESVVSSTVHCPGSSEAGEVELTVNGLLNRMSELAVVDYSLPQEWSGDISRPAPKQHAMKAQAQFFRHVDHVTDVFVQDNFLANVNRVYAGQIHQVDEPWVICFQTIILLVLGSELLGASSSSVIGGLASSFFLPTSVALVNARLLMAPRLINVQALILLSVLAQQQDSQARSELLFAQACTLAKTIGLHKAQATLDEGLSAEENQERWMVCRSLYLRDQGFRISHGTVSWLPDSNFSQMLGPSSDQHTAYRGCLELASLQEKIYRLANSRKPLHPSSKKAHGILTRIQQDLKGLAQSYGLFRTHNHGVSYPAFQLNFLATRIGALQESPISSQGKLIRADARASCLVLLLARGDCDRKLQEQYDALISTWDSAYPSPSDEDVRLGERAASNDDSTRPNPDGASSHEFLGLLDTFPASAFFLLVLDVLWPFEPMGGANVEDDSALLHRIHACYHESTSLMPPGSYPRRLESIFQLLLQIVSLLKRGQPGINALHLPKTSELSQQPMDVSMHGLSAWPTTNSMQDPPWGTSPDFASRSDVAAMLSLPPQPDDLANVFDNLASSGAHVLSRPLPPSGRNTRRKRSHNDVEHEPQFSQASVAQGEIDSFMTSPESLLFSFTQN
ncbi:MAG: hypothetical protein Q9167_006041 [Letrouitia subvulpina]